MNPAHPRILVLGGTSWLGGAVVRAALGRGGDVVCLARGESGTVPEGAEHVVADRWAPGAYAAVADQDWDLVVDVSWQPELVRSAVSALADRARHWVYVSSCSVYAGHDQPGADESAALLEPWEGAGEVDITAYGPAKVSCETACVEALGAERVLLARAGLIGGYGDLSDRFGYWPARMDRAREGASPALLPPLDGPVQLIDVDDLATWLLEAGLRRTAGAFNAVGDSVSFREVLDACTRHTGIAPELVIADQEWLVDQAVRPWAGSDSLPLWLPLPEYAGHMTRSNDAARRYGLQLRPVDQTVVAALAWERTLGTGRERKAGLSPAREAQLVAVLRERASTTWG
jgi:nucleoside-diphosphate-sugar epimerase